MRQITTLQDKLRKKFPGKDILLMDHHERSLYYIWDVIDEIHVLQSLPDLKEEYGLKSVQDLRDFKENFTRVMYYDV